MRVIGDKPFQAAHQPLAMLAGAARWAWPPGEAIDRGMHQLLLEAMCRFWLPYRRRSRLGGAYRLGMRAPQCACCAGWRPPDAGMIRQCQCLPKQCLCVPSKIFDREPNIAPTAGTLDA